MTAPTIARAAAPILLVLASLAVPWLAGAGLVALTAGAAVGIARRAPVAWAWAGMVPAAALATVRAVSGVVPFDDHATCQAFGASRLPWSLAEALVVVASFTGLAVALRTRRASIGMRVPARFAVRLAIAGAGMLALAGLAAVAVLRGVPGPADPADPAASSVLLAVLVGALAIATAEEIAFRGVLQHWLARTTGEAAAVLVQGVAYGMWVAAVGWGPAMGIAAAGAGIVAGLVTARTRSIVIAWAWHVGVAVPLLATMLCR
ncbi:MAG TPA: CPBP family intramembrane glutamic endopeptidase [Candidatus Limnocylindrales bacterium]